MHCGDTSGLVCGHLAGVGAQIDRPFPHLLVVAMDASVVRY